jgi:hypothetical protein
MENLTIVQKGEHNKFYCVEYTIVAINSNCRLELAIEFELWQTLEVGDSFEINFKKS